MAEAKTQYSAAIADLRKYNFRTYATRMHKERDKTGTLLARLAKQDTDTKPITEILDPLGTLVLSQTHILCAFRHYYATVYRNPTRFRQDAIGHFLDPLPIPHVTEPEATALDAEITETDVTCTIRALARNKAPGLDGLRLK